MRPQENYLAPGRGVRPARPPGAWQARAASALPAIGAVLLACAVLSLVLWLVTGFSSTALAGEAGNTVVAGADALASRAQAAVRGDGERVGACVQVAEDWTLPHYPHIPGTIFVSVASYRDDECRDTVADMFEQADSPNNIFVGVCQQNKEDEEDCFDRCATCAERKASGHIRVANFDYMDARGPTFARYQCSKLWRGEEFFFQIDSHLKFEPGWDTTLLNQMRATNDPKAVLGCYPPTQEQLDDMKATDFQSMIVMCAAPFDDTGLPTIRAELVQRHGRVAPLPIAFQPAGMICFPGKALHDVPYDPYLSFLFFGEELLFSARLWTAGYNLYAPTKNFAVHHYGREGKPKYWDDHSGSEACKRLALQRAKYLLGMASKLLVHADYLDEIDRYGMGTERSLDDYWAFAGVSPLTRTVTNSCPAPEPVTTAAAA